ncbi:amidohydrolase family protein (plasmid) [Bacillus sp. F19]|nr:amidohydrolase family protein [Bacillus sp. F19]
MRIDSHQHFWTLYRGDYGWLTPELKVLFRDYLPGDLLVHLKENQFDQTILVQAAPTLAETEYLLRLYEQNDFIAGVVGWLNLESANFEKEYKRLKSHKGFVGIRPMLQDLEDDQWILRPEVNNNIQLLVDDDFPIDILVFPRHLPYIIRLLKIFPNLRAVINHIAKPDIANGILEPWKDHMAEIALYEKVMCKCSGMITEAKQPFSSSDIQPYVQHIISVFSAEKVMFGSDWPVCLLAGDYKQVYETLKETLPENLSRNDLQGIFGKNAARFYKLH